MNVIAVRKSEGLRRARVAVTAAFLLNGFAIAMWVVNIPAVAAAADVGNAVLGTTLLALGAGSVVAMQATGHLAARVGSRIAVGVGAALLAAGTFMIAAAGSAALLATSLFVLGLGNGAIDVAMNDQAIRVQRRYGRPIMSAFHAMFSLGGAAGAGFGALLQSGDVDYRRSLWATALLVVLLAAAALPSLLPREPVPSTGGAGGGHHDRGREGVVRRGVVLGGLAFALMLVEGMVNDWSALHATQHLRQSDESASLAYLFFAVTMTAGRLIVDRVVARVGPVRVVRVGSMIALAGLTVVIVSPVYPGTVVGWVVLAAGLAGIVPQIFTAAGDLGDGDRAAVALSRVVSAGYLGMLAGPAIIGWISAAVGINLALLLALALLVTGVVAAPSVRTPPARTISVGAGR